VTIQVHQSVLERSFEFFKRAVKPEWKRRCDEPDRIDITEHAPEVVKAYAHWLYSGKLATRKAIHENESQIDVI
jgi:hypothetical protein